MLLLDLGLPPQLAPILYWAPVWLRPAQFGDYEAWKALREESREQLTAWEPAWNSDELTPHAFRRRMRALGREIRRGSALPLLAFRQSDNALVGGITLSNIRFGASRSAGLGYWIGAPFLRRGYGRAALAAVLDHAFRTIELNRVEAACQPENIASRNLLESAGFGVEGLARDYLRINNAWRDHLLLAMTAAEFCEAEL